MARSARRFAFVPLVVVTLISAQVRAEPPVVLLVKPATSGAVTRTQIGQIHQAVNAAIVAAGASAAVLGDAKVQAQLKSSGATDLSSRPTSMKVAKGIGAHAVLRYQIIKTKVGTKLRMAVYTVAGKASLLEREQPEDMTNAAASSMVRELLKGALPSAGAGTGTGTGTGTGSGTGSSDGPGAGNTTDKRSSSLLAPAVWSSSGITLQLHIGGAIPLGGGDDPNDSDATQFLDAGVRFALIAGYEIKLGEHASLAPEVAMRISSWSWDEDTFGLTGGITMINVGGGARFTYYVWRVGISVAVHLGFGNVGATFKDSVGGEDDDSVLGFGFGTDFGAQIQIVRYLAAGLFFDVTKTFSGDLEVQTTSGPVTGEVTGLGFSVGLAIKGKIPL